MAFVNAARAQAPPPQPDAVARISTDVLKMNFMKRTMVRMERNKQVEEQQQTRELMKAGKMEVQPPRHYPTVEHIDDDPNITLGGMMTEWRYTVLLDNLRFGRFSYKGQNPEVEKLMLFHERRRLGLADEEEEFENEEEESGEEDEDEHEEGEIRDEDGEEDEEEEQGPAPKRSRIGQQGGMEETYRRGGREGRRGGRGMRDERGGRTNWQGRGGGHRYGGGRGRTENWKEKRGERGRRGHAHRQNTHQPQQQQYMTNSWRKEPENRENWRKNSQKRDRAWDDSSSASSAYQWKASWKSMESMESISMESRGGGRSC